jgi:DNA-binding NarL/FixJ family response regulator
MAEIVKHDRQDSGSVPRCSAVDDIGLMVVVAQATDATHATVEFRRHRRDITLMDFRPPDAGGMDGLISIRSEFPDGPHLHADHIRQYRDSTHQQRPKICITIAGIPFCRERQSRPLDSQ